MTLVRVNSLGNSTGITIPIVEVKKFGLKVGDYIDFKIERIHRKMSQRDVIDVIKGTPNTWFTAQELQSHADANMQSIHRAIRNLAGANIKEFEVKMFPHRKGKDILKVRWKDG
jgi:antitoxin component of MazEF toxin-antitoxin module